MDDIVCEICSLEWDDTEVIPKVLNCGHTICSPCLTKLIQTNPSCPKCRNDLTGTIESCPTNFALLGLTSTQSMYKQMECHLQCRCLTLKNKLSSRKEDLMKKKSQIISDLDVVKASLTQLQELLEAEREDLDVRKMKERLMELEAEFAKIEREDNSNYWKIRVSVTINMSTFDAPDLYLQEIYESLSYGKEVYSVHAVDNKMSYGKVSIQNNMILVHALSFEELSENVVTVWLDDLKKAVTKQSFHAFLKICCNNRGVAHMVLIEMKDSNKSPQFLRLCTGECGPTYKGCHFVKGDIVDCAQSILNVSKYLKNNVKTCGPIDYVMDVSTSTSLSVGDIAVMGMSDGSFKIAKCTNRYNYCNVIGKIISPTNLENLISYDEEDNLKIIDCGLVFEF